MTLSEYGVDGVWMAEKATRKGAKEGPGAPIPVQHDSNAEAVHAAFVASKGKDDYAATHVCMSPDWLGRKRLVMRSDQENVSEECVKEVKEKTAVEVVLKASPVGESQSNGMV